ncbi:hypothetical protein STEG23_005006 [Scotinomys teguina]
MNDISSTMKHKITHSEEPLQAFHGAPQTPTSQLGKQRSSLGKYSGDACRSSIGLLEVCNVRYGFSYPLASLEQVLAAALGSLGLACPKCTCSPKKPPRSLRRAVPHVSTRWQCVHPARLGAALKLGL